MSGTRKSRASVAIAVVVSALVFVSIGGAAPPGTQTQAAEAAACAALYGVPAAAAPDPVGVVPVGHARNRGDTVRFVRSEPGPQGARVGDIDTGIDLDQRRHHAQRRSRCLVRVPLRLYADG